MKIQTFLLFSFSVAIFYFSSLGTIPFLEPDEGRYAEIPREMLASGDFVTPRLNGVVYLEKPPLYYWGTALSMRPYCTRISRTFWIWSSRIVGLP